MKIYIVISCAGHYHAAFRTYKEAEQEAINKEISGYEIWEDTI